MVLSNAQALLCWQRFWFFDGEIAERDIEFLLIGVVLAVVVVWVISRRRRRWF